MKHYPFFFSVREKVSGNGFLAEVVARGRVLAVEENEGWWFFGVEPGGLAEGAPAASEALKEFRQTFNGILYDIAVDARDFESFRAEVLTFFHEVNDVTQQQWLDAVREVQCGAVSEAALPRMTREPIARERAETPSHIEVVYLEPRDARPVNQLEADLAVAAQLGSFQVARLSEVWKMLRACAKGFRVRKCDHYFRVTFNGKTFPSLPTGRKGDKDPEIFAGKIRQMITHLRISVDCARKSFPEI